MAVVEFRRSCLTQTPSATSGATLAARSALRRVINKLQLLVLQNPSVAVVVLGLLEGVLDE